MKDRSYKTAGNPKYDGCQRALTSTVYTFFDKETGSGVSDEQISDSEIQKKKIICNI